MTDEDMKLSINDTPSGRRLKRAMDLSDKEGITIGEAYERTPEQEEPVLYVELKIVQGADRFAPVQGQKFVLCEDEDGTEIMAYVLNVSSSPPV